MHVAELSWVAKFIDSEGLGSNFKGIPDFGSDLHHGVWRALQLENRTKGDEQVDLVPEISLVEGKR